MSESGFRVKIHRGIAEIDKDRWNAIVDKNRMLCAHEYAEALERSGISEGGCYYPVVYDGDEIVAHACVYLITTEVDLFAQGIIKKIITLIRRKWNNFFILRILECGSPISVGTTVSFKDGINRPEALRILCRSIEDLAKELGVNFILFRDFYNEELKFYAPLKERGYMTIHNLPKAEIKIRWKSFDEYLNSMRSEYRCKIIKNIDKCAKENVSFQVINNFLDKTQELKRLYDNVYNQAKEIKRERLNESFFQNMNKYLGEKIALISATKDGRLIGYMLLLFSGKTLISKFPGLDYALNKKCGTYFNLFYKTIEIAIETGMNDIDMGITTLDPKKDMGSRIVALNMYMKHSNRILNKVIPLLFDMIAPPDTTGSRNVFKEQHDSIPQA